MMYGCMVIHVGERNANVVKMVLFLECKMLCT
jgi:hypothetical protein